MRREIGVHPDFFEAIELLKLDLQDIIEQYNPAKIEVSPLIWSFIATLDGYVDVDNKDVNDIILKGKYNQIDIYVNMRASVEYIEV
jgi:hypothetical protein